MLLNDDCTIKYADDHDWLYVEVQGVSYRLAPWRAGMACFRYDGGWRYREWYWHPVPDQPYWHFGEYLCRPYTEHYTPVARYLAPIPLELRRLASFTRWMQIPALRLLHLTPYAAQLAANEPVLFWLMAVAFQEQRFTAEECLALFRLPRRKILAAVMGEDPGGRYLSVSTLHKLNFRRYNSHEYSMFMALYKNNLLKTARHAPSICLQTLIERFTTEEIGAISVLLGKVPSYLWPEVRHYYRLCRSIAKIHENALIVFGKRADPPVDYQHIVHCRAIACRDLHDLRRLRYKFEDECHNRVHREPDELPPFPPPPLAGSDTIVPITTPLELKEEGIAMEHCVSPLAGTVSMGGVYIYRVLAPERGTLSVSIIDGQWQIEKFCLRRNAKPNAASLAHVQAWLTGAVADKPTA